MKKFIKGGKPKVVNAKVQAMKKKKIAKAATKMFGGRA